jgi:hypothetical protein
VLYQLSYVPELPTGENNNASKNTLKANRKFNKRVAPVSSEALAGQRLDRREGRRDFACGG